MGGLVARLKRDMQKKTLLSSIIIYPQPVIFSDEGGKE